MNPLVEVRGLRKEYDIRDGFMQRRIGRIAAVDDVDLDIYPGETLGIVGESGCGKSTLGRLLLRLIDATAGTITFAGEDVRGAGGRRLKALRREMQMVFQDPAGSLNPRMRIGDIISEGLTVHGIGTPAERRAAVADMLVRVGLDAQAARRFPHEFSGGGMQRIAIARALMLRPRFIVADEPVSALDVSIQSQVLNLMSELKEAFELTIFFVAHDIAVVGYMADRIAVMYLGKVVEVGPAKAIYRRPQHPYTTALVSAVPAPFPGAKQSRIVLQGDVPSPMNPPSGCRFRTRCPIARPICAEVTPPLAPRATDHAVACHFPGELRAPADVLPA